MTNLFAEKKYLQEVGDRIRYFRKARGYTLDALSPMIGKSKSILSKYERGDVTVDIITLQAIASALQISVSSLLENAASAPSSMFSLGPGKTEEVQERYFVYNTMSRDKATLQKALLVMGATTAALYGNIRSEEDLHHYECIFAGEVKRKDSFTRLLLSNVLCEDDIRILDLPPRLGEHQCSIAFAAEFSVGGYYPIAGIFLLSKVPIRDEAWLYQTLSFSREDLKKFRYHNAFFSVHNFSPRLFEIRKVDEVPF